MAAAGLASGLPKCAVSISMTPTGPASDHHPSKNVSHQQDPVPNALKQMSSAFAEHQITVSA